MATIGAHEVAVVILVWLLITFGPLLAKLLIVWAGRRRQERRLSKERQLRQD